MSRGRLVVLGLVALVMGGGCSSSGRGPVESEEVRRDPPTAPAPVAEAPLATVKHVKLYVDSLLVGGDLNASVDLELARPWEADRLYAHAKATCVDGGRRLVGFDQTGLDSLDRMGLRFFSEGAFVPSTCEVDLRASGREGAVWIPLGVHCLTGGNTTAGPCPELARGEVGEAFAAFDAKARPMRVDAVKTELVDGLALQYEVALEGDVGHSLELITRMACRLSGRSVLEIDRTTVDLGAFSFEAGDVLPMRVELFDDEDRFDRAQIETTICEARILAQTTGQEEAAPIHSVCVEEGVVSEGACSEIDFAAHEAPDDSTLLQVVEPRVETYEAPGGDTPNGRAVRFDLDVLAHRPLAGDPTVRASVKCDLGNDVRVADRTMDTGTAPEDLRPGEVSRLRVEAFRYEGLPREPRWCELSLSDRFEEHRTAYATLCWRPDGVSTGPCG